MDRGRTRFRREKILRCVIGSSGTCPAIFCAAPAIAKSEGAAGPKTVSVLQSYRDPHIPVVSDRYGVYLFEQQKEIQFAPLPDSVTSFDHAAFIEKYRLGSPKASNFFVAIYTSELPFSGKAFHGNDVSGSWHQGYGKGKLAPGP